MLSHSPRSPAQTVVRHSLMLAVAALLLGACAEDTPAAGGAPEEVTYAADLGVDLAQMERAQNGLYQIDDTVGQGQVAMPGDRVVVHYTGWLPEGTEFDSSRGGTPFEFTVGAGEVIPGWDEGVAGMREGGVRKLVIPAELAYGDAGAGGVIPPNATLVFEVELLDVL